MIRNDVKQKLQERYQQELHKGEFFWPDSVFRDAIVALGVVILVFLLATFVGVPNEPKVDPADTTYLPRPEWYFLFLFKFLALYGQIPVLGKVEWLATVVVPGLAIGLLLFLPFIERSQDRYYAKRAIPLAIMTLIVVDMVILTLMAEVPTVAPQEAHLGWKLAVAMQPIAGLLIPGVGILLLLGLPRIAPQATWRLPAWIAGVGAGTMIVLALAILVLHGLFATAEARAETTLPVTLAEQILAGQDLYSVHCVECHGEDGRVTVIEGVEGLDGTSISPIHSRDVLYTLNDASLAEIIAYGRPDLGMPPFGKQYNPEGLSKSEIDYIVLFMRYMWDDRFEPPAEVLRPLFPPLAAGEVPSYEVHIAPIVKRYCVSCHRPGKSNNNYLMTTYEEILSSGDHADHNVIAGDPNSYLLLVVQGQAIQDAEGREEIGVMPPRGNLPANAIDALIRWVMNGMPRTASDAARLTPVVTPTP